MVNSKISVIVPIYNVEKYLERCLMSIENQTYHTLEVILVDDGSTDDSKKIAMKFCERDERFTYHYKNNGGLSSARNFGLDICTGDYIFFVDSDDYIELTIIEKLYRAICNNECKLAMCNFTYVYENSTSYSGENYIIDVLSPIIKRDLFWNLYYSQFQATCAVVWNKLYEKKLFESIRFPHGKINEDEFILFDIIDQVEKIAFVSDPLYFYVQRENSIMGARNPINMLDGVEALLIRTDHFSKRQEYGFIEYTISKCFYNLYDIYGAMDKSNIENMSKFIEISKFFKKKINANYKFVGDKKLYCKVKIFKIANYKMFVYLSRIRKLI